jgi:hypothetical protein
MMWIVWVILVLGFIAGSALILLRTTHLPKLPESLKSQHDTDESE